MRSLQILMPMGGLGQRFSDGGYTLPKPLIPVDGIPMFKKALSSLDALDVRYDLITVFRQAHEDQFQLSARFKEHFPEAKIILIEALTRGAVETCLFAEPLLRKDAGLVVLDCDLWFDSPDYLASLRRALASNTPDISGALTYFEASAPKYSFVRLDEGRVVEIAEKRPISTHAVIGSYFFSKSEDFVSVSHELLKAPPQEAPEYYVSSAYSRMIKAGAKVVAHPARRYHSFGTPEELSAYERQREN